MLPLASTLAIGIATLFAVVAGRYCFQIFRWLPGEERNERFSRGLCPSCGYDLTANTSGICPECGTRIDRISAPQLTPSPSLITERQPWWVWTIVLMAMIIYVALQRWRI
jgi:hypothetical protein